MARRSLAIFFCSPRAAPRRIELRDTPMDGAMRGMRARQVPEAHQELADDLAPHEGEGAAEQLHPFVLGTGVVRIDPGCERAVLAAKLDRLARVPDRGVHLEPIADDARIAEK